MENNLFESAQTDGAELKAECSESTDMLTLARTIDSCLNPRIKTLLKDVAGWNRFLEVYNNASLVPVGSSQDGSKANVLGDSGDVDILLISKTVVLDESLLEYDIDYPAFLRVPGDGNHLKLFKLKRLVENKYVPVNILKHLERRIYGFVRFVVSVISRPGLSADGKYFNLFKETAVGFEIAALDGSSTISALHRAQSQKQNVNKWDVLLKIVHGLLDSLTVMVHKCDPNEFCISQSQRSFSSVEESVTSAGKKIVDLIKHKNDNFKMKIQIEKRDTKTDPIYRNSESLKQDAKETSKFHKFMTADIVPAFTIQGWPRVAKEWITRNRKWPSNNVVHDIIQKGCQIVAKRPLYPKLKGDRKNEDHSPEADENDTCFRLSFAQCEIVLAKQLTEVPFLCWKILKAYQKAFLRTEPPVLTSYHWKTVLLWIREETDDDFWSEGNLLNCVIMALTFMRNCLERRFVPLYFVREENLIAGCCEKQVLVTIDTIYKILQDPSENLSYVLNIVNCSNAVYESSKEEIEDHLSAESHENIVKDLCENWIHGGVYEMHEFYEDAAKYCDERRYDIFNRYCDNMRHGMQVLLGEELKPSTRLVLTLGFSFVEKLFNKMVDKDSSESDSENDQVLFFSEQITNYTTQRTSMIGDIPSKANEHDDQTRKNNDSSTVKAQTSPLRNEDIARDKNRETVNIDVECVSDPQRVEELYNYQIKNAGIIHTSTRQKNSSFHQLFMEFLKFLQSMFRRVSGENVQDSNDGDYEFDSDLLSFAKLFETPIINHINEKNETSTTPCDFELD